MKWSYEAAKAMQPEGSDMWTVEKYCKKNLECQYKES